MNEVTSSLSKVGKGTGLDGLPPSIAPLFPPSLCQIIFNLLQLIFNGFQYPKDWKLQLPLPPTKRVIRKRHQSYVALPFHLFYLVYMTLLSMSVLKHGISRIKNNQALESI